MPLAICATPIGNLGDVTYRAIEVLSSVRRILAEDTRRTRILCHHYGVTTPLVSLHEHNEAARTARVLEWLNDGDELALVSDAGTPLLSDPGARLVAQVTAAGHPVVPIPGASALLAALVASGLEPEPFTFFGFLPRVGKARDELLASVAACPHTSITYDAPNRVKTLLAALARRAGPERRVAVARELTKIHESFVRGTLQDALTYYDTEAIRGEVVIVLAGASPDAVTDAPFAADILARTLLDEGTKASVVARELTRRLGLSRREAYKIALSAAAEGRGDSH
jgi:16S rRNA (cytidine1402-2'-O)-methyltransferase